MHIREKVKSWMVKIITPELHRKLRRNFKERHAWELTRASVSAGLAAGLLFVFIPLPIQMISSILLAYAIKGNILVAAVTSFISNPFTFLPINYLILYVGGFITGQEVTLPPIDSFDMDFRNWPEYIEILKPWFQDMGKQFLIGLLITSIVSALLGYILVNILWLFCSNVLRYRPRRK